MDEEMFTFFPHGIRALIVDDDQKFLKSAKMMLDLLHFKVATCGSPSSALRLLSDDGGLKDVDVVLADAHKVVASGFDLRAIVEPDLGIPVIYRHPTHMEGDDSSALFQIVQSTTYIIKKPLDASELTGLWRVVAYRKCVLDARGVNARASSSAGRQDDSQPSSLPAGAPPTDDDGEEEAARVHYKVVTVGSRKKK
ncbi:two-component response regulator ORR33 [Brachypodium distachyon]|uniref:two-component response regulator ORR33 n=1 Tax=Brachypodium distachyon TaxID=15368 RepID=UPI00052FEA81|nr:two-component response regulator ORR33 [Brachypodium distachyon]|eukprot:XP_010236722.1 two-component response regulator ORR33 [Brachypodium distachyon]